MRSRSGCTPRAAPTSRIIFPRRNRIVAGCSDAVLVVESGTKGGSLITAELATDYGRELFAIPGRPNDPKSQGCHALIKQHKAHLVESGDDVAICIGCEKITTDNRIVPSGKKTKMAPAALSANEARLLHHISAVEMRTIDQLQEWNQQEPQTLAAALINLELAGLIVSLPGNRYQSV